MNKFGRIRRQLSDKLRSLLEVIIDRNQKGMIINRMRRHLDLEEDNDYNFEVRKHTLPQNKKLMFQSSMMGLWNKVHNNLRVLNLKNKIFKRWNMTINGLKPKLNRQLGKIFSLRNMSHLISTFRNWIRSGNRMQLHISLGNLLQLTPVMNNINQRIKGVNRMQQYIHKKV